MSRHSSCRSRAVSPDDVVNTQHTSGTTGFPKGVMLSSRGIVNNAWAVGQRLGFTPADRLCLCAVPLFHAFGWRWSACLDATRTAPVSVRLSGSSGRRACSETIQRERCTALVRRADDVSRRARVRGVSAGTTSRRSEPASWPERPCP